VEVVEEDDEVVEEDDEDDEDDEVVEEDDEDDEDDEVVDGTTTLVEMVLKIEVRSVIGEDQVIGLRMVIFLEIIRVSKIEAMMDILVLLTVGFRKMELL